MVGFLSRSPRNFTTVFFLKVLSGVCKLGIFYFYILTHDGRKISLWAVASGLALFLLFLLLLFIAAALLNKSCISENLNPLNNSSLRAHLQR